MAPAEAANGSQADDALRDLLPDEDDLLYEEELLRNPYSLRMWIRYLDARKGASPRKRYLLYERALNALPGSYKVRRRRRRLAAVLAPCTGCCPLCAVQNLHQFSIACCKL